MSISEKERVVAEVMGFYKYLENCNRSLNMIVEANADGGMSAKEQMALELTLNRLDDTIASAKMHKQTYADIDYHDCVIEKLEAVKKELTVFT